MTTSVLLRLAGPLQAWGVDSRYRFRAAGSRPSKSGMVGMIAAALGRGRDDIADLAGLRFAVRIDQPGTVILDFHTSSAGKKTAISERYYISDAVFVAAFEGPDELITEIEAALRNPVYVPFLGRMSCPPEGQLSLGLRTMSGVDALNAEPWHAGSWWQKHLSKEAYSDLPVYRDAVDASEVGELTADVPESFSLTKRVFRARTVVRDTSVSVANAAHVSGGAPAASADHDPFDLI